MEEVAQIWRALQAKQVSGGSSLLSYLIRSRNTDIGKSPFRKYS